MYACSVCGGMDWIRVRRFVAFWSARGSGGGEGVKGGSRNGESCLSTEAELTEGDGVRSWAPGPSGCGCSGESGRDTTSITLEAFRLREKRPKTMTEEVDEGDDLRAAPKPPGLGPAFPRPMSLSCFSNP